MPQSCPPPSCPVRLNALALTLVGEQAQRDQARLVGEQRARLRHVAKAGHGGQRGGQHAGGLVRRQQPLGGGDEELDHAVVNLQPRNDIPRMRILSLICSSAAPRLPAGQLPSKRCASSETSRSPIQWLEGGNGPRSRTQTAHAPRPACPSPSVSAQPPRTHRQSNTALRPPASPYPACPARSARRCA